MDNLSFLSVEEAPYAVVDTETTGLGRLDRIIEISVILANKDFSALEEYSSLVNPRIPVTAQKIHGITGSMLEHAPDFSFLSESLCSLLEGRVFVAHNAAFDITMIEKELSILGKRSPIKKFLCTKALGKKLRTAKDLRLSSLCTKFGIVNDNAHRSLSDARATLSLLSCLFFESKKNRMIRSKDLGFLE